MKTIPYFHDTTIIDQALIARLNAAPGDLVVVCSRDLTIVSLLGDVNYIFAADLLKVNNDAPLTINPSAKNPHPCISILAGTVNGKLTISSTGVGGTAGADGEPGFPAEIDAPGGPGGNGQKGGIGGMGGAITICYVACTIVPLATSLGGPGGPGGQGGPGGTGYHRRGDRSVQPTNGGRRGSDGAPGDQGPAGTVAINQLAPLHLWDALDAGTKEVWTAYRTEVGAYLYRKYDNASLKLAILEFKAALLLDANNILAKRLLLQIIQQQIPSGLSRNLDLALDYAELAKNSTTEAQMLQSFFNAFQNTANVIQLRSDLLSQLKLTEIQLKTQLDYAELKAVAAQQNLNIAENQSSLLSDQIKNLQDSLNSGGFFSTLGTIVKTVGEVAAVVVSIATGVGAIVSIPAAIVAVSDDIEEADSFIEFLTDSDSLSDLGDLGKGLGEAMDIEKGFVNFTKIISDIANAKTDDSNGALGKLAELVKEKKIADLKIAQANTEVEAAQALATGLHASLQVANNLEQHWDAEVNDLNQVADTMIKLARLIADKVADDIFISARALEIYQLQTATVHFDYGYIHPDSDRDLPAATRAAQCENTLGNMVNDIVTSQQIYSTLNLAQIQGFDVVHPSLSFVGNAGSMLTSMCTDKGLSFSTIASTGLPASVAELKVNAIEIELTGCEPDHTVNVWIEHSGHWLMYPRNGGRIVEFNLNPRKEAINCKSANNLLSGQIPNTQVAAGTIPFSFWGRGVLANWRIFVDAPDYAVLANLSQIKLIFYCIGFAQSGHTSQTHTIMDSTFQLNNLGI